MCWEGGVKLAPWLRGKCAKNYAKLPIVALIYIFFVSDIRSASVGNPQHDVEIGKPTLLSQNVKGTGHGFFLRESVKVHGRRKCTYIWHHLMLKSRHFLLNIYFTSSYILTREGMPSHVSALIYFPVGKMPLVSPQWDKGPSILVYGCVCSCVFM